MKAAISRKCNCCLVQEDIVVRKLQYLLKLEIIELRLCDDHVNKFYSFSMDRMNAFSSF